MMRRQTGLHVFPLIPPEDVWSEFKEELEKGIPRPKMGKWVFAGQGDMQALHKLPLLGRRNAMCSRVRAVCCC